MTDTDPNATSRREASRDRSGRFGDQQQTAPEAILAPTASKVEAKSLVPGDVILTETNTDTGPFGFALMRSRDLRRRWAKVGLPQTLTVISTRRADEDGHTDDAVTFDLGGEPLELTFHRERPFTVLH